MSKKVLTDLDFGGNKILNADVTETIPFKTAPNVNNKVLTEADAGGGSDNVVFVTTENTYAEVLAYYNAGKEVIYVAPTSATQPWLVWYLPLSVFSDPESSEPYFMFCLVSYVSSYYNYLYRDRGWIYQYPERQTLAQNTLVWMDETEQLVVTSVTLYVGESTRMWQPNGNLSVTLSRSGAKDGKTEEWYFSFYGNAGYSVSFTPPSGYTILWGTQLPTSWSAKYYEFSFKRVYNSKIIGYYREVST